MPNGRARHGRDAIRGVIAAVVTSCAALGALAPGMAVPRPARGADAPDFTVGEIRRILGHGPWPPVVRDPSNRASGHAGAIALGQRLFFEPRLSAGGAMSCATCHVPAQGWTDGRARGVGTRALDRNTPSVWNVGLLRWFGWDGAGDSLWAQSIRPILDSREMGATAGHVAAMLRSDAALACGYTRAFGRTPHDAPDDETLLVDAGKALAAFMETLVSGRTPFDEFRGALARGDAAAARRYPVAAQRGLAIFVGRGRCSLCHFGPAFTNGEFSDVGVPFFAGPGRVDSGRHGGIMQLRASPFTLLSRFNDDASRESASKTRHVELHHRNFGEFKVPPLRNVARTAPYMHDGRFATLRDVVRHYSEVDEERLHGDGERIVRPLRLSAGEIDDLVAFLESLTDAGAPYVRRAALPGCP